MTDVLLPVVSAALLSSVIYLGVAGYRHFVAHLFVPMSRDGVWMSPLSYLVFFLVPAIPVAIYARRLTSTGALRAGTALAVWLAVFAILLPETEIHRAAAALLAAGVAAVAARVVGRWEGGARRLTRWLAIGLGVALACVGAGVQAWRAVAMRRDYAALAALRSDGPGAAPNVLLIILDTVRAASMSLYGYERQTTPQIDDFAKRGVVFDWAMSASPWTLPSHASMFTGHYAGRLSTGFTQPLDASAPTLAEVFRDRGYETVGFVANQHYTAWDSGLERGFVRYFDFPRTFVQLLKSSWYGQTMMANELYRARNRNDVTRVLKAFKLYVPPKPEGDENSAEELTNHVLRWQATRQARPFFAFLNYYDAHTPYNPLPKWRRKFAAKPKSRDLYEAEIAYIDDNVGRLLRTLEDRGALANTLVIIAADHGEHFGEHKLFGHGNSVYLPLLHVPLVMVQPGRVPAGVRVTRTVSLRDMAATITSLTGTDSAARFPGTSLASFWSDAAATGSTALAELYRAESSVRTNVMDRSRQWALVDEQWHFVSRPDAKPELYAYRRDGRESANLADSASVNGESTVAAMRQRILDEVRRDTLVTMRETLGRLTMVHQ